MQNKKKQTFKKNFSEKKGEFNFVWLFALIAGSAILLLAIYGATKGVTQENYGHSVELAKAFSVVLGSSGAGASDLNKIPSIKLRNKIRLQNTCSDVGFGENSLSVGVRSANDGAWQKQGGEIDITSQYIFSSNQESKQFEVFSMPFKFPFKVADVIFLTSSSESFCFKNAPKEIERVIRSFQLPNWKLKDCSGNEKTICFQNSRCDINIYGTCTIDCKSKFDEGYVEKDGERLYFIGGLMYGAILSEKELYDCNINRLLYRAAVLSDVLSKKASLMDSRGCPTSIQGELSSWSNNLKEMKPSDLNYKNILAKNIEKIAKGGRCKVW